VKKLTIGLKTSLEVARVRKAGEVVAQILREIRPGVRPGTTTSAIAAEAEAMLERLEAGASLKGYRGYSHAVCTSVNHVAVHGLPNDAALMDDDILTVDLAAEKDGWHADGAWTYAVGTPGPTSRRLIRAAWSATLAGIAAANAGARFGDVGHAIEEAAIEYGCSVMDRFVGHGIGQELHEDPMVLNTGEPGTGPPIVPGMVFTVEPILSLGGPEVFELDDGWSMVSQDHALCAQFEHTVAVFGDHTDVLTGPALQLDESPMPPF